MATVTPGKIFTANEIVTPANLNALGVPTVSNIVETDLATNSVTTTKIANGAVTQEKLNSSVTLVPTGAVMPFAMNSAPSGWLAADGTAVSRTTYATLFAAIGTIYGAGNGSTTFNLPDLRGYFVRGAGTNSDNKASGTFGAKQADAVIAHTHSGTTGNDSPDHTHAYSIDSGQAFATGGGATTVNKLTTANTGGASTRHLHDFTTSSQSPAGTTETRPANIALLYCIKA
jgi:microcystin-dependent protein